MPNIFMRRIFSIFSVHNFGIIVTILIQSLFADVSQVWREALDSCRTKKNKFSNLFKEHSRLPILLNAARDIPTLDMEDFNPVP